MQRQPRRFENRQRRKGGERVKGGERGAVLKPYTPARMETKTNQVMEVPGGSRNTPSSYDQLPQGRRD